MNRKLIFALQVLSLAWIWVFVLSVDLWILSLLQVARELNDSINASIAIGMLAIPLFLTIAVILTYVFVNLQRYSDDRQDSEELDKATWH